MGPHGLIRLRRITYNPWHVHLLLTALQCHLKDPSRLQCRDWISPPQAPEALSLSHIQPWWGPTCSLIPGGRLCSLLSSTWARELKALWTLGLIPRVSSLWSILCGSHTFSSQLCISVLYNEPVIACLIALWRVQERHYIILTCIFSFQKSCHFSSTAFAVTPDSSMQGLTAYFQCPQQVQKEVFEPLSVFTTKLNLPWTCYGIAVGVWVTAKGIWRSWELSLMMMTRSAAGSNPECHHCCQHRHLHACHHHHLWGVCRHGYQRLFPPLALVVLTNIPMQMAVPVRTPSSWVLAVGSLIAAAGRAARATSLGATPLTYNGGIWWQQFHVAQKGSRFQGKSWSGRFVKWGRRSRMDLGEAFREPVSPSWYHQRGGLHSWRWALLPPLLRGVCQGRVSTPLGQPLVFSRESPTCLKMSQPSSLGSKLFL